MSEIRSRADRIKHIRVVNDANVVLGTVSIKQKFPNENEVIKDVMDPAPTTFRPAQLTGFPEAGRTACLRAVFRKPNLQTLGS
jgi:hypothetical protein